MPFLLPNQQCQSTEGKKMLMGMRLISMHGRKKIAEQKTKKN